jgi:hypothetical protein
MAAPRHRRTALRPKLGKSQRRAACRVFDPYNLFVRCQQAILSPAASGKVDIAPEAEI